MPVDLKAQPTKIREDFRCPHCGRTIVVWLKKNQTLEQQFSLHKSSCAALREVSADPICKYLGGATDLSYKCGGCGGGERTLFRCDIHGYTLPFITQSQKKHYGITDVQCCIGCEDRVEVAFGESDLAKQEADRQLRSTSQASTPPTLPDPPLNKANKVRMGPYG